MGVALGDAMRGHPAHRPAQGGRLLLEQVIAHVEGAEHIAELVERDLVVMGRCHAYEGQHLTAELAEILHQHDGLLDQSAVPKLPRQAEEDAQWSLHSNAPAGVNYCSREPHRTRGSARRAL